ncbi:MAG: peptide deformylase [Blastochloris sp.]|jgi:peptide deformylase|nr:peptide deformylase [Blastochloris sp.]
MVLEIVQYGDPALRKVGKKVSAITTEIKKLVDAMLDAMHAANGVGLAAQQVGQALQLAVIEIPAEIERPSKMWIDSKEVDLQAYMPLILINPEVVLTKKKDSDSEGCLSFPGLSVEINRAYRVSVTTTNLQGERWSFDAAGLLGRAVQHEVDHLNGVLFIDRLNKKDRELLKEELEEMRAKS